MPTDKINNIIKILKVFLKKGELSMKNQNVIKNEFKNYKKTAGYRKKRMIRILAVIGSILMLSGLVGSIICYLQ